MSRHRRRIGGLTFALAALLWGSLGTTCGDFVSDPTAADLPVTLKVKLDRTYPFFGDTVAIVDLVASTSDPFQAFNLTLSWDSGNVKLAAAQPHPSFDDDGKLFAAAKPGAKSLSNIVDLRHGGAAASGSVRVAKVALVVSGTDPVKFKVSGRVAAPDGAPFTVVVSESWTFTPGS